ncbi:MAG: DUF2268 domain-containing protein [Alistipes senegalensis]|nr:DUF2268 domain-containing protein [Bacteroides cellulosilyticus]MCM1352475.1 DUF2268 domain-containing protein [Alistipes senegalensis]
MRYRKHILLIGVLLLAVWRGEAQYYSWGADAPMKWSTIRTPDIRVIFPDSAAGAARRSLYYADRIRPDIGYGFARGPMRLPFVLHAQNFEANGVVMYMPKRVELLTVPEAESYSMTWLKQLTAHEYRHTVQFNNLNRGVFRVLRYLAGQQSLTVGLLCMPGWAMEGDAVMAETQMSSFGRALQPSFTLGYRAMRRVGTDRAGTRYRRNTDKWFCGSYREYIPDHYRLGYQINAYAETRYGENVWNKVARYGARNPYVIATTHVGLKKYYGTTVNRLFRETFDALQRHWDSLPARPNSARPLCELPDDNYTTYCWPLPLDDSTVLAVKEDYDRTSRFVAFDRRTGTEKVVARTGSISSRPIVCGGRVWWSEYRRSTLFEERVGSRLCYMDLADGRPRTLRGIRNALYPTAMSEHGLAWVEYAAATGYSVVRQDGRGRRERMPVPVDKELHGLAWDDTTDALYALVTDDSGMWLGRFEPDGTLRLLTEGAYITLRDLRARSGSLYFGSIASGYDEVHRFDLATGRQYRLTTSTYGAFDGMPAGGDSLLLTTYDRHGYALAVQPADTVAFVAPTRLPENIVNPPRKRWPVVNLDTVRFCVADSTAQTARHPARRYRKALHALNVHSWLPVAFDPFEAVDEHVVDVNFGATVLSQNLLSNTEAFASYGWNRDEGSLVKAGLRYDGWGVRLAFGASYGGDRIVYGLAARDSETGDVVRQPRPAAAKYHSFDVSASLPLLFHRGYHTRRLTLSAAWNYSNGKVADLQAIERDEQGNVANLDAVGYRDGLHKLSFGVSYSDQVRMAYRDFLPRFGWQLLANCSVNPANDDFSKLVVGYGHLYLPGFAPHHSLKIAATYQTSLGGARFPDGNRPLTYRSSVLIPTGFASSAIESDRYRAVSVDYQLPVWYPDGGICAVLYVKRIRLNLGGQGAAFRTLGPHGMTQRRIWSVGGDLIFDFNAFRTPASYTSTFRLSVYRPSSGGVWVGGSLGLPF